MSVEKLEVGKFYNYEGKKVLAVYSSQSYLRWIEYEGEKVYLSGVENNNICKFSEWREPLVAELKCYWEEKEDVIVPFGPCVFDILSKFSGKETKVRIEEIL